jgi:hypothetical protein
MGGTRGRLGTVPLRVLSRHQQAELTVQLSLLVRESGMSRGARKEVKAG